MLHFLKAKPDTQQPEEVMAAKANFVILKGILARERSSIYRQSMGQLGGNRDIRFSGNYAKLLPNGERGIKSRRTPTKV